MTLLLAAALVLQTARAHPIQYWISKPDRPAQGLVIAITGAEKDWKKSAERFAAERDALELPFTIVVPLVLTNSGPDIRNRPGNTYPEAVFDRAEREGRCTFDVDGLSAIARELSAGRFFLTGLEAGGHLAWAMAFQHPELLAAVAPVRSNYQGRCMTAEQQHPFSSAGERLRLPIRIFTDDHDLAVLQKQQDRAIDDARAHGYSMVTRESKPSTPSDVLRWFGSLQR